MSGPHQGQHVAAAGVPLERARALVVLVHGRGATAESILELSRYLWHDDVAYLAPQAAGFTWYPQSFLAPLHANEPGITSGLQALADVLSEATRFGIPSERQILVGFSQGACLATEFAARNPRRFGGVVAFSGGLIGPPGMPREYDEHLDDTPVFFGSSDPDPHVPWARVEESADILNSMGAEVTLRRYPGMGHTVNDEEIAAALSMIESVAGNTAAVAAS